MLQHKYLNVGAGLYFGAFLLVVAAVESDTSIALATSAATATYSKRIGKI